MKEISQLYDSHVHFLSTGLVDCQLNLRELASEEGIANLKPSPSHFRGDWLVGFGWNENNWDSKQIPSKESLDKIFPDFPVYFVRADGHAAWTNTQGLLRLKLLNTSSIKNNSTNEEQDLVQHLLIKDSQGLPTGILLEQLHYRSFEFIPQPDPSQIKTALISAIKKFNHAGFTHIRDMSSTLDQWNILSSLDQDKLLTIHLDANFTCEKLSQIDDVIKIAKYAKQNQTPNLSARGIKIYYDGSLGSETALLSRPYLTRPNWSGLASWDLDEISEIIKQVWDKDLEISVHTIGDLAVEHIVDVARKVSAAGHLGKLNLEHVEIIRPETIQKMKPLHIRCHLQPCHWHSDHAWLRDKIGDLSQFAFPWESLRMAGIPFSFGSDSPIEEASLFSNLQAIHESAKWGVKALNHDPIVFHCHPDSKNVPSGTTRIENGKITEVTFNGKKIFY